MYSSKTKNEYLGAMCALIALGANPAFAQTTPTAPADTAGASTENTLAEVVVTAQKRQEDINRVGMSIQAFNEDDLTRLGVSNTADLQKIVPGFSAVPSQFGAPIYTIRGVGFQDSALGASPTVSIYADQFPLPFSVESLGASLDLQRVEVLKGPQGTLFGENSTGGAVNYIANLPTDTFTAGVDASYSRFNTVDLTAFVSGPVTSTLDYRLVLHTVQSGPWQESFTHDAQLGSRDFDNGRMSLLWKPTDQLQAILTLTGTLDRSETQAGQFFGIKPRGAAPLPPGLLTYPDAPPNDRAADWGECVRTTTSLTSDCGGYRKNDQFYMGTLRLDYDIASAVTLTSLTSHERFVRYEPSDLDGTVYENYSTLQTGHLDTTYQELRASGKVFGAGNWVVGGNYQDDTTVDVYLQSITNGSLNPTFGLPVSDITPATEQKIKTYAAFADIEYPVVSTVTLQAGARYTKQDRDFDGCVRDSGDGQWGNVSQLIAEVLSEAAAPNPGLGGCASLGPAPSFTPELYRTNLNQSNVSWRGGVNWEPVSGKLLYATVSQGYKSGSFPTVPALLNAEFVPVVQESLRAYEVGMKASFFDRTLQLNAAGYYYNYTNKQVLGDILTPIFGPLQALVNVPKSRVSGFEVSGAWLPVPGLTIMPAVSYANSRIQNHFTNYSSFGVLTDFDGEHFPLAPVWQGNVNVRYEHALGADIKGFVGGNVSYQDKTNTYLGQLSQFKVPSYSLLDLYAGVERGPWTVQAWGRNVLNRYYWTSAYYTADTFDRFTGQPATYGVTLNFRFH